MEGGITWRILSSELGSLIAGTTFRGCCLLEFVDRRSLNNIIPRLQKRYKSQLIHGTSSMLEKLQTELTRYFAGLQHTFSIPLDVRGTPFQMSVWEELLTIPYGETRSYIEIARSINKDTAVRAVGKANGDNNIAILTPCHRVISSSGELQGYGGGLWRKKKLLSLERKFQQNMLRQDMSSA